MPEAKRALPPLPREVRDRRLSLDGPWEIRLDPGAEARPIRVPFTFESELSGIGLRDEVHEHVVYRRTFTVPDDWDEHVLLRFGGVDWAARVLVDGREIGSHAGGYTHFSFDLGPLGAGSEYELVVEVDDPAQGPQPRGKQRGSGGIWYTRTTGIWRPVWLESVPAAHIRAFRLDAQLDGTIDVRVSTSAHTAVDVRVGGETVRVEDAARLRIDEPRLWSPDDPYLYDVELATESGDLVRSYVALRKLERRGPDVLLNGERRFLCGVLDQAYWPDGIYTAPDDDALRRDVELTKELGFDLARMHVKVADPRWYGWCDRLGLLVCQDIPSSTRLETDAARDAFRAETREIVEQLRDHPCVVMWVAINEDWGEPTEELQLELARTIREATPAALTIDASGWKHRGETDLIDIHDYGDDLSKHASSSELPTWIGECGGVSLVVAGNEDFAYKHVTSAEELAAAYERLVGTLGDVAGFVWTQLTDVEGELNGLLTNTRSPKAPTDAIREANERVKGTR